MRTRVVLGLAALVAVAVAGIALAGPADVDTTFGAGGLVTVGLRPLALVRDAMGRSIVAGGTKVTRLTAAGAADPTFNAGAVVNAPISVSAAAVQSDGKVILAGFDGSATPDGAAAVARLNADGTPDTDFGIGGKTDVRINGATTQGPAVAVALDPTGRIVIAGSARDNTATPGAFAARVRVDAGHVGQVDMTFNAGGSEPGVVTYPYGTQADAVAVSAAGKATVAGAIAAGASQDFFAARLDTDGTADTGFGPLGRRDVPIGTATDAEAAAVAVSGSQTIVGGSADGSAAVLALGDDGTPVTGFGTAGVRTFTFGGATSTTSITALAIRPGDAEILTAGDVGGKVALARLTPSGALDARFGARSTPPGTKLPALPSGSGPVPLALPATDAVEVAMFQSLDPLSGFVGLVGTPNRAPPIGATSVPSTAQVGETKTFTGSATDPDPDDADPVLTWSFGDGSPAATGTGVTHAYATAGTYTVTLTATDAYNAASTPKTFSVTVTSPTPPPPISLSIAAPFGARLLSSAPFDFTATASPGVTLDWDFGEPIGPTDPNTRRTWTEADLANPGAQVFEPEPGMTGATATHTYQPDFEPALGGAYPPQADPLPGDGEAFGVDAGIEGKVPPVAPDKTSEVRRVVYVRVRARDQFGQEKIVGTPVVIQPDQPPSVSFEAQCPSDGCGYEDPIRFISYATDPDERLNASDAGGRDYPIRNSWDFQGRARDSRRPASCNPRPIEAFRTCAATSAEVDTRFTDLLHGLPPLDQYILPAGTGADRLNALRAEVAAMGADGPGQTGLKPVKLTVTDRSGRTRSLTHDVYYHFRRPPQPRLSFGGATGAKGETIPDGIIAGQTPVSVDLSQSTADPHGKVAYHVIQVGTPKPTPCTEIELVECKPQEAGLDGTPDATYIVKGSPGDVKITFPKPSGKTPLSVLDTAYDETGAEGVARYDGFKVIDPTASCQDVAGRQFGKLRISASCVDYGTDQVFWTARPIEVNGLRLKPTKGQYVIVDPCGAGRPKLITRNGAPAKGTGCNGLPAKSAGPLQVLVGDDALASVDADPLADKAPLSTLLKGDAVSLDADGAARYKGLPLASQISTKLLSDAARLQFTTQLPAQFGGTTAAADLTQPSTPAGKLIITAYNGRTNDVLGRIARRPVRAHRAASAPSVLVPPDGASLGPIDLKGQTFRYHPEDGTFQLDVGSTDVIPILDAGASLHVVLKDGKLLDASGKVEGLKIPVGGVLEIDSFSFDIKPDGGGLKLTAQVGFGDLTGLGVISGSGMLTTSLGADPTVEIKANATLVHLLPVNADVKFAGDGVTLSAGTGFDFGLASFSANFGGGFSVDDAGKAHFQVTGDGRACLLFACLHISGIASDRALAGCGSINLFFVKIAAGFGYVFPTHDTRILKGSCDLGQFATVNVRRDVQASPTAVQSFGVPTRAGPTAAESIEVPVKTSVVGTFGIVREGLFGQVPQVRLLAPGGTEIARSSLTLGFFGIDGNEGAGDTHHVLVDEDPVAGRTRFIVPNPAQGGTYTVEQLPGTVAIGTPGYAFSDPPVDAKIFSAISVQPAGAGEQKKVLSGAAVLLGGPPGNAALAKPLVASKPSRKVGLDDIKPSSELDATLKPASTADPDGGLSYLPGPSPSKTTLYGGTYTPPGSLTEYSVSSLLELHAAGSLPAHESIDFYETGRLAFRKIGTVQSGDATMFDVTLPFTPSALDDRFLKHSPEVKRHCVEAVVSDTNYLPRGSVQNLACFLYKPPPTTDPSKLGVQVVRTKPDASVSDISLDPNRLVENNAFQQFVISLAAGPTHLTIPISGQAIADRQAAGHARSAATGSLRFTIHRFHIGRHKLKVSVRGVAPPGSSIKPARVTTVLKRGRKRATVRFTKRKHHRRKRKRH